MTLRKTIYFKDFNSPYHWEFDDDEHRVGPSPKIRDIVTWADFSKEFYMDARVMQKARAGDIYPKCREDAREERVVRLEEIKRDEQLELGLREYDNGLLNFPNTYYDEDPDYEEPPSTPWMMRSIYRSKDDGAK